MMALQDRHDINFVRRQITAIEIELMPDKGEEIDPIKVARLVGSISTTLGDLQDRLEGTD